MTGFFNPFSSNNQGGGGGTSEKVRYSISKNVDLTTGETTYRLTQRINGGSPTLVGDVIGFDGSCILVNYGSETITLNEAIENLQQYQYELPPATTTTLGGIKVGSGLEVEEDGTLNATARIYYNNTAYWNQHSSEITEVGALYIYLDGKDWNGNKVPRLKIGNGILTIGEMPFVDCSCTPDPGEPIYIDEENESIDDPGIQDIFPEEPDESFSFSGRVGTSADGENETLHLNF